MVVTFTLVGHASRAAAAGPPEKSLAADEVGSFIGIDGEGIVTIYSGKVDLGTGVLFAPAILFV